MSYLQNHKPITLTALRKLQQTGHKLSMLTCYDAGFAGLMERAGVEILLIGDSLGNVIQGQKTTLPVTLEQMVYHTECVARGCSRAFIVADLSFGSYQESKEQALRNAARVMAAGAQMVKMEGGEHLAETVAFLVERGIPVCGHIGLTPQSVNQLGGYRIQGKDAEGAETLRRAALALEQAGAEMLVMEMVPQDLGAAVTQSLTRTMTIGIGAGPDCDGQVLVVYDMLGISPGTPPRFAKNFMTSQPSIESAVASYVAQVRSGQFPAEEHCY